MRAKPTSNSRAGKSSRGNGKSNGGNPKGVVKRRKEQEQKVIPDLSVLRQPVDTSVCGLKQAVKVFETGTPEVLHLLTYDCDVVYECKVCRNLFRSIANFISHKRVYCTERYSRSQDLRSNKEGENYTVILEDKASERLPTRITARKDLTSIVESLSGQTNRSPLSSEGADSGNDSRTTERRPTTVHLEPMDNTTFGVFQTVLNKPNSQDLMKNQVTELQNLLSQNEVVLGPDGRILQNGVLNVHHEEPEEDHSLVCSACNVKFANRKTLSKHKRLFHEAVRTSYSCPCCKNYFANPWSVYRHLYKVHRKTNEQVRRLRSQIHKKDIKVDKSVINNTSGKKAVSPNKKRIENENHLRVQQDNKEWMDHFEDDWELQRCGGCGRKFERKAALISHSQICQKRIAACNRIEQNHQVAVASNPTSLIVAVSPLSCSKKPVPKPSPEKKIGIQVRMNYCKNSSNCNGSPSQISSRQQNSSKSVLGDENDIETLSVDEKESFFQPGLMKSAVDLKESSVLEQFLKNASKCHSSEGVEKVNSYLSNSVNRLDKVQTYEISTCKRSTFLRSNVSKNKNLEAKCMQLRSALENGVTESKKSGGKDKAIESAVFFDNNIDNTSESNTSAISSLSSQLTPLVDKGYVCEVEESIEIKNINISRTLDSLPSTEADSTSMSGGGGLTMTYNSRTYTGNIKFSPTTDATCEEVSTSVVSDESPQSNLLLQVDSSSLNDDDEDDEVSINLKPLALVEQESKIIQESELENTISILTRNQLKAICKDDLMPSTSDRNVSLENRMKRKTADAEIEAVTRELIKKKLHKYVNEIKNSCNLCHKRFKNAWNINQHIPIHTQWKRYKCLFNGCRYETFTKKSCVSHIAVHTKDNNKESPELLVGIINPSKWNLKLSDKWKTIGQTKTAPKVNNGQNRANSSQKLVKTVNRLPKKPLNHNIGDNRKNLLKINIKRLNEKKKTKLSRVLTKVGTKQKLLTDYKTFSKVSNLKGKGVLKTNKLKKIALQSPKRKLSVQKSSPKRLKEKQLKNGVSASARNLSQTKAVKATVKKEGKSTSPPRRKLPVIKKEVKEDEIVVNHLTLDSSSETGTGKGRVSRTSSRKSSVNSVDQPKGKLCVNTIVKIEDSHTNHFPSDNYDSHSSIHIRGPEIVDGSSSMEEEESQESDRPVDDSHLKKIFMEVIFGPTKPSNPVQSPGRPVRNKSRPKRDNDFILGSQKDDKEIDDKSNLVKKSIKCSPGSRTSPESSKKSK
uniref:C2H2-type domain-containing protein n=1 Tax=Homalodisca liturata TaxID=320908 RepID=A0A1B6IEY3_9HEMI